MKKREGMDWLQRHRAHDYPHLVRRWREWARVHRIPMRPLHKAGEMTVYFLQSGKSNAPYRIYLSAGIHGDEPASTEALITWVESRSDLFQHDDFSLFLLPCINPWGLIKNSRTDDRGRDLNRMFLPGAPKPVRSIMRRISRESFHLAVMLHEDYDARGVYLYELQRPKPCWGEELINAAAKVIPPDPRLVIEGRKTTSPGVMRRKITPEIRLFGPEAIYLYDLNCARTFTIETPSEFSLESRVRAHVRMLDRAVELLTGER